MERFILNKLQQYKILSLRVLLTLAQVDTKSPFDKRTLHRDFSNTLLKLENTNQIKFTKDGVTLC